MPKYEPFEEPIEIPQFYFSRMMYDIYQDLLTTDEEKGQFLDIIAKWHLFNILDTEKAKQVSPAVADAVNRCITINYNSINKYRHDYFNGSKGGRPKINIPHI